MSQTPETQSSKKSSTSFKGLLVLLGLAGISISAAGWHQWASAKQAEHALLVPASTPTGSTVAVTLRSGQVFYGELVDYSPERLHLAKVFYVQSFRDPNNNQVNNQLIRRSKGDWHGPEWMVLNASEVTIVEGIGADSKLAQLMKVELAK